VRLPQNTLTPLGGLEPFAKQKRDIGEAAVNSASARTRKQNPGITMAFEPNPLRLQKGNTRKKAQPGAHRTRVRRAPDASVQQQTPSHSRQSDGEKKNPAATYDGISMAAIMQNS